MVPTIQICEPGGCKRGGRAASIAAGLALTGFVLAGCAGGGAWPGSTASSPAATAPAPARSLAGSFLISGQAMRDHRPAVARRHVAFLLDHAATDRAVQFRAFAVLFDNDDFAAAVELARSAEAGRPGNPMLALTLAVDAIVGGRYAEAARRLADLPETPANRLLTPLLGAWVAALRGQPVDLAKLDKFKGFTPLKTLHLALIASAQGDTDTALKHYRAAGADQPGAPLRVAMAMARDLVRGGRLAAAKALLAQRDGNFLDPEVLAADLTATAQNAGPWLSLRAGAAEALFDVATALQRDGQRARAMFHVGLALYLVPTMDLGHLLRGEIWEARGRPDAALTAYDRVAATSPYRLMADLRRADALDEGGERGAAADLLRRLMARHGDNPEPAIRLGDLFRGHKEWAAAIAAYDTAVARMEARQKPYWSVYYARGIALERAKIWDRAEADFLTALKLNPEQPYVMNYLGYSWTEQGRHLRRAEKLIRRAAELRPRDGYIVDSLGWIHYQKGAFDTAVKHLERAVELRPADPVINDHLGDAYWRAGRRQEARYQWRRVLLLAPDPELRRALDGKLTGGLPAAP